MGITDETTLADIDEALGYLVRVLHDHGGEPVRRHIDWLLDVRSVWTHRTTAPTH